MGRFQLSGKKILFAQVRASNLVGVYVRVAITFSESSFNELQNVNMNEALQKKVTIFVLTCVGAWGDAIPPLSRRFENVRDFWMQLEATKRQKAEKAHQLWNRSEGTEGPEGLPAVARSVPLTPHNIFIGGS
jgi:hypothetical protein